MTSLTNIEAVDNLQILNLPKRQADSSELQLKVLTPKRALDSNMKTEITVVQPDKQYFVDKENSSTNNNAKSQYLAVNKETIDVQTKEENIMAKLHQNCYENDSDKNSKTASLNESLKQTKQLIGNENDNLLKSFSEDSVHEISITESEKSKPSAANFISTATPTVIKTVKDSKHFLLNSEEMDCSMENSSLTQPKLLTPQKTSQKDKLMFSVKRNSRKKTNPDRLDNSMKSTNCSPSNKESKSSSSGTPKISPRRLRKRKSGVTPILSSSKTIKRSKLSVTRNSTGKTTPQTSLIELIQIDDDEDMITGVEKNKEQLIVNQKLTVSESTLLGAKLENTNSALVKIETSKSEKENINVQIKTDSPIKNIVFSPVKIVLSRIPMDQLSGVQYNFDKKIGTLCNLLEKNQKKESLSSIICSNTDKILTECEDHLESSIKNLNSDAPIDKMHTNLQLEAQNQIVAIKSKKMPPKVVVSSENERHNTSVSDIIVEETKTTVSNFRTKLIEPTDKSLNKSENLSRSLNGSNKLNVSNVPMEDKEYNNVEMCKMSNSYSKATRSAELIRLSLASSKSTDDSIDKGDSQNYPSDLDEKSETSKRIMSNTVKTRSMDDKLTTHLAADLSNRSNEISTKGNTISMETEGVKQLQSTQQDSTPKYDKSVNYEQTDKSIECMSKMDSSKNDKGKGSCGKRAIEDNNISAAESSKLANFSVVKDATEISLSYEETIMEEKLLSNKKNSQSSLKLNSAIFECKSDSNLDLEINVKYDDISKKAINPKKPSNNEKSHFCQDSSNKRQSHKILQEGTENNTLQSKEAVDELALKINDVEDTSDSLCKQSILPKTPERSETNFEKSVLHNLNLHVSTPIKSGQKNLKQTQLPFTPIRKFSDSHADSPNKALPADDSNASKNKSKVLLLNPEDEVHSPFLVLEKMNLSKYIDKSCSSSHRDDIRDNCEMENKVEIVHEIKQQPVTSDVKYQNRQEVPRTPEKKLSPKVDYCTDGMEVRPPDEVIMESPMQLTESEDVIASSQENELSNRSCIISNRASNSCTMSPLKILRNSPLKVENTLLNQVNINCSERVLRNSPTKISPRSKSTPIKKSVCRRLDVEIDKNTSLTIEPQNSVHRLKSSSSLTEENTNKMEYSFVQLQKSSSDDLRQVILLETQSSCEINKTNDLEISNKTHSTDYENLESQIIATTENGHASSSKLCQMESNLDLIESPIRKLRFDGADSPKSPSSRTNQMMELAMLEKEKTVSSPATNLLKKRRVLPVRLGPIAKTLRNQR